VTAVGLSLTRQAPAAPVASITLDDTPSRVWADLANSEAFQAALVDAVRDVARGRTTTDLLDVLKEADADALHGAYAALIVRVGRGDRDAMFDLLRETRRLGTGRSSLEDILSAARLFDLAEDITPTLEIRIGDAFRNLRASTRRDACALVATLARGCDCRLVATGLTQRWLVESHRADLPVSREDSTSPTGTPPVGERVEAALATLDVDSLAVTVLRALEDQAAHTLAYSACYATFEHSDSRIRQVVGQLVDLECADTFQGVDGRMVELTSVGEAVCSRLDSLYGRQANLAAEWTNGAPGKPSETEQSSNPDAALDCVSDPGNRSEQGRVNPYAHEPPPPDSSLSARLSAPADAYYLSRSAHAAAAASAVDSGVSLIDYPIEGHDNGLERGWSYDAAADQLVISVEYHNPLQYWVSVARALANWRTFHHVLDADRLDAAVFDEIPDAVLRDARCLGWLKDENATGEDYIDALEDAREDLLELTRKLAREEYDDRDQFRSAITRDALGLASTLVHLLDVVGVDVVREVRLPEFSRNFDADRRADLVQSIAKGAAIQSRYEHFAAYRQLFEDRGEKRQAAFSPEVDAADPIGKLIGSFVLVGPGVDALKDALTDRLRSPGPLHEDAPEFAVSIDVTTSPGRPAFAAVTRSLLDAKQIDATRDAVSVVEAFTATPYDAATALAALGTEDTPREARIDEIRYALGTLPANRILPDAAPTVSKVVHALLTTERAVSKADLADLADVSTRSLRTHLDRLVAFDIVREAVGGYRLALSTSEERYGDDVLPWYATPNRHREDYRDATEKGMLAEVCFEYGFDGSDAVLETTYGFATLQLPPDVRRDVLAVWPWGGPLLDVVRAFAAEELDHRRPASRVITFGAAIEQTALGLQSCQIEYGASRVTD
jgi:hypothetical protein